MKYTYVLVLLTLLLSLSSAGGLTATAAPRPNILYFYVDDMGWGSIGPNGQAARRASNQPSVRTPNLDQLAARGVNFRRGYACTVYSPSRASQQSGFHQGHAFADRNDPDNARKAMRADDLLMGDVLSAAGYVTGYWGKWGYGGSKDQVDPTIDNVQTLPTSHGYQFVLAAQARLTVAGGTVSSLRWMEIDPGGVLQGTGSLDTTIYNHGAILVGAGQPGFDLRGDYQQSAGAALNVVLSTGRKPALVITGKAHVDGTLTVTWAEDIQPTRGQSYPVLTANRVAGKFANPGGEVMAGNGTRFNIRYSESAVTLTVK